MARIVTLGGALQDIYLIDRDDFEPSTIGNQSIFGNLLIGSKADIDNISYEIGGGGVNAAISFARHGHDTIIFTNIAHDPAGNAIIDSLDREGIDSSYINISTNKHTGCSIILLDKKSGERTILTHRGTSNKFDNLDEKDLDLIKPDWLYITTLHGDMHTILRFCEKAHSIGAEVMLNPGAAELNRPQQLVGLLSEIDILLVNKAEAAKIVSGETLTELLYRLSNYLDTVIITDSSTGGIATNGKETYRFGIYEDVKVADTTGAGDAFGSGFLAHLATGKTFKESLIYASANSTSVVSKLGANNNIVSNKIKLHQMPIQEI